MYIRYGIENGATLEAGEKRLEKGLLYSANCLLKCSGVYAGACMLIFSSLQRIMKIQFRMFLIVLVTIIRITCWLQRMRYLVQCKPYSNSS